MPSILIASPTRAILMNIRAPHGLDPLTVLGSSAIAAADLIAVQPAALAAAVGAIPQITTTAEASLHMHDTPLPLVGGSPAVVAAPVASLWQSDRFALKVKYPVTWTLRDTRGVAWLTTTKW